MGTATKIEWTDRTFNPWWGCARVSPACRFCYADDLAKRWGENVWRRRGPRKMMSDATWRNPVKWNRDAEATGTAAKVFCASMADVFEDHPDVAEPRQRLWRLIEDTPWLRWQLLTKRPENVAAMAPWGSDWPGHVWLGTSVENQRYAEQRIPHLLASGAKTRFLSCEPLLGPVDLSPWIPRISWVIVGGESGAGKKLRPMDLSWAGSLVEQCDTAGVPVFVKQLGTAWSRQAKASSRKGGDPDEWPAKLRIRRFPHIVGTY